jgi:hypothetical protein
MRRASAEGSPQRVGGVREHRVILRWRPNSRPAFACSRKRCSRTRAKATSECNSTRSPKPILRSRSGAIRSSIRSTGPNTNVVLRARDAHKLAQAKRAVEQVLGASAVGTIKLTSLAHGENRGSSPLGSANDFRYLAGNPILLSNACPINACTQRWTMRVDPAPYRAETRGSSSVSRAVYR